ncbi:MAG: hypothetical protein ACK55Z_32210, partial [bacterium]
RTGHVSGPQGVNATPQPARGWPRQHPRRAHRHDAPTRRSRSSASGREVSRVSTWLKQAIDARRAEAIKSYRRALHSGILRLEDAATRAAQARRW